jgi:hypothetical protein
MYKNDKAPAKWVHTFNVGDGTRVAVSEKGAFKLSQILPSGEERFMLCLQPKHLMAIVNAAGEIGNFLVSDEYKAIEAGKANAKERDKLTLQIEREKEKLARTMQAAAEALARLNAQQSTIKAG